MQASHNQLSKKPFWVICSMEEWRVEWAQLVKRFAVGIYDLVQNLPVIENRMLAGEPMAIFLLARE